MGYDTPRDILRGFKNHCFLYYVQEPGEEVLPHDRP